MISEQTLKRWAIYIIILSVIALATHLYCEAHRKAQLQTAAAVADVLNGTLRLPQTESLLFKSPPTVEDTIRVGSLLGVIPDNNEQDLKTGAELCHIYYDPELPISPTKKGGFTSQQLQKYSRELEENTPAPTGF